MHKKITYHFDWDAVKAASNLTKHGVAFKTAMSLFSDPLAMTCPDIGHSEVEERWVTIGMTDAGVVIVVAHTFRELKDNEAQVRLISARRATPRERWQYENNHFSVHEVNTMKDEYDFSGGERGKFYRRDAVFEMPIYLKPEILAFFIARAAEKNVPVDDLLNEVLARDIERIKAGE